MTIKVNTKKLKTNVIQFKNYKYKKRKNIISSTIAAIIAVKVDHPENVEPEDYLIDYLEQNEVLDVVAFEDALDSFSENISSIKNANNYINDA